MQEIYNSDKRKLLSSLSHASIFLSGLIISIGIPIAIYLLSEDPVVKANAREAINFHFNVWLYGIILVPLSFITFGLAGGIWWLAHWAMTTWAIIHCLGTPEEPVHYPFIFRPF